MRELVIEQTSGGGWFPVQIIVSFQTTVCIGHQLEREREEQRDGVGGVWQMTLT